MFYKISIIQENAQFGFHQISNPYLDVMYLQLKGF